MKDIRPIFVSKLVAIDTVDLDIARKEKEKALLELNEERELNLTLRRDSNNLKSLLESLRLSEMSAKSVAANLKYQNVMYLYPRVIYNKAH